MSEGLRGPREGEVGQDSLISSGGFVDQEAHEINDNRRESSVEDARRRGSHKK